MKKMKNNNLKISLMLFILLSISGCGQMEEVMKKSEDIQKSLTTHCDCEEVRMINYSINNFTTTANYELVGCKFRSPKEEALRILTFLKKDVQGFCDIDEFTLDFINKGNHRPVLIEKCKLSE
jgi:hypothetical protein